MNIGSCQALFHISSFVILSGHVEEAPETDCVKCLDPLESRLHILYVSTPYNKTDFTLELGIRRLVVLQISLEAQLFYSKCSLCIASS